MFIFWRIAGTFMSRAVTSTPSMKTLPPVGRPAG